MSDATRVAFQLGGGPLAEIDSLGGALRAAVPEFIARRREQRIDAEPAAGHGVELPDDEAEALAEVSIDGLTAADLDW